MGLLANLYFLFGRMGGFADIYSNSEEGATYDSAFQRPSFKRFNSWRNYLKVAALPTKTQDLQAAFQKALRK